jgi:hypothetical protein
MILLLLGSVGCLNEESTTMLVPSNPFSSAPGTPARTQVTYSPASLQAATRVDTVSRKLLEANREIGIRPQVRTIGAPQPEIFHVGTREVDITEGLVNQCKTEGELAAVLARELGKMISERELQAGPKARSPERTPPQEVRIGNDPLSGYAPDLTHLAELGKYDKQRRQASGSALPPPDPQMLARAYLTKAGYADKELDAVTPLVQAAATNSTFEKQMSNTPPRP